jgi:hypothetical protein
VSFYRERERERERERLCFSERDFSERERRRRRRCERGRLEHFFAHSADAVVRPSERAFGR